MSHDGDSVVLEHDELLRNFRNDKHKVVDYVLAYEKCDNEDRNTKRLSFFKNLKRVGLETEFDRNKQNVYFLKIHAPMDVLKNYCGIMRFKMPIKETFEEVSGIILESRAAEDVQRTSRMSRLFYEFSNEKDFLFETEDASFFTDSIRIAIVHFILERQCFSKDVNDLNHVGIQRLLTDGVYTAAYPLHDGNKRRKLLREWASVRNAMFKPQPLDEIKEYFGVKIAIYFAWLGFYTKMLIPAALVGVACFFYGFRALSSNEISKDICDTLGETIMCPQCDTCDYWKLKTACKYSRVSGIFDNDLTVAFAFFISVWVTFYLELWKRYLAKLQHRWGISDYSHETEHPRPEFVAKLTRCRKNLKEVLNPSTGLIEPIVSYSTKITACFFSYSIVLTFMFMAIAAVISIIVFRMAWSTSRYLADDNNALKILMPATAAMLNLLVIFVLNHIYGRLSIWLNDLEFKRSQTEYDESLTLKTSMFQFINYYSSIFYIAFIKGKFIGHPGKYNKLFGFRQEECSPGGCLMELFIQLSIIMIGKQAINAVVEYLKIPVKTWIMGYVKTYLNCKTETAETAESVENISEHQDGLLNEEKHTHQFSADYKKCEAWPLSGLFDEYLEMVIQYGFITLFVVAFPLAPLFALLNNVFEMRLDARKFLLQYRRSVPARVRDIGVWYKIMLIISKLAIITNAFIIAFSTNFIPRMVYHTLSGVNSDVGFFNYTLAYFNTSSPHFSHSAKTMFPDVEVCRYSEYRNPPSADPSVAYKRPAMYWHVMTARLAFIVVFQNIVGLVQIVIAWAIPDVPSSIKDKIKRENYVTSKLVIEKEKQRAMGLSSPDSVDYADSDENDYEDV